MTRTKRHKNKITRRLIEKKNRLYKSSGLDLSPIEHKIRSIVIQDFPLTKIVEMKDHRRFKVFYQKGTTCVSCNRVGCRVIKRMMSHGSIHYDLYTQDLIMMTLDHIRPKSKGGTNAIENMQPMCAICNQRKGNKLDEHYNVSIYETAYYIVKQ